MIKYIENTPFEEEVQKRYTELYNKLIRVLEIANYFKDLCEKKIE